MAEPPPETVIAVYLSVHSSDERRLTPCDWVFIGDICSVLDPIADVNIKSQGSKFIYTSQPAFLTDETLKIMGEDKLHIRRPVKVHEDYAISYHMTMVEPEANEQLASMFEQVMEEIELYAVWNAVECVSVILYSRRSRTLEKECLNCGDVLR